MKLAIYGYGNVGKGVECSVMQNSDVELTGIFTRRNKNDVKSVFNSKIYSVSEIDNFKDDIDVLAICGGSATELPVMTVSLAKKFNVIDTFDTHANIYEHFTNVDKAAKESSHIAMISCGWDPGMFSLNRLYAKAILPKGKDYTFWGRGVSQGHSDAIRRIKEVIDAKQYTVPVESVVEKIKNGDMSDYTVREKHKRECFVVVEDGADKSSIENEIKTMPHYFDEYDTTVNFITMDEFKKNHTEMPHAGFVIRTGTTGKNDEHKHTINYNLKLDSNPEFTASAVVAFARALYKEKQKGTTGCLTVFDIRPRDLINVDYTELLKHML